MIDILFCGNDKVFDGVLTCALSLFRRTQTEEPFHLHCLTMDATHLAPDYRPITPAQGAFLAEVARSYHPQNRVTVTDVTMLYRQELGGCPNESAYCSPYTLIRLLCDLVDGMPQDKLLYLDADVLFQRDVRLLWDIDITGYEYAAACDHYGKYLIHPHYINAGVLLFNMSLARQNGLFARAREKLREKKWLFADQSALIRATTRRKILPQTFNDQKFLHKHTVVRHFSRRLFWFPYPHIDNIKQWQVERVHRAFGYHAFDDILEEYLTLKQRFEAICEVPHD